MPKDNCLILVAQKQVQIYMNVISVLKLNLTIKV